MLHLPHWIVPVQVSTILEDNATDRDTTDIGEEGGVTGRMRGRIKGRTP